MVETFKQAIEERRSVYAIGKDPVLSNEELKELIEMVVKNAPTAFNSQGGRVLVLLQKENEILWAMTKEILRKIVPEENFADTEGKMDAFAGGTGTILFFEEQNTVKDLQEKFSQYKDNFPVWSLQSSGMLQYALWTTLEAEGYGVNLQHYNPLIDEAVQNRWNIPQNWKLLAQMPFGKPVAEANEKTFLPLEDRVKFAGL